MNDFSNLFEMISAKLRGNQNSELLKTLVDSFKKGGSEALEEKIKEILSEIEEE